MPDPDSSLTSALSSVSVLANSVWWPEGQDPYRLANLNLWVDYVNCSHSPPIEQSQPANRGVEVAESSDPTGWLRGHPWPQSQHRSQPQLAEILNESSRPFKIQTIEELKLYRKISKESVKNIWSKPEPEQRKKDPLLNANVPEFYPSVLFHHIDYPMQLQPYLPINDQTYQLFPYFEQNSELENQWRQQQVQGFNRPSSSHVPDWHVRAGNCSFPNVLFLQRPQRLQSSKPMIPPQQGPVFTGPPRVNTFHHPGQPQHQQVILSSDFPELPTNREKPVGEAAPSSRLTADQEMLSNARTLEGLVKAMPSIKERIPPQTPLDEALITGTCSDANETRRLYRDVLASKSEEDSQTAIDGRYEELEREALEQYISSEDSEAAIGRNDSSDPFQDLERQAVEQYDEQSEQDLKSTTRGLAATPSSQLEGAVVATPGPPAGNEALSAAYSGNLPDELGKAAQVKGPAAEVPPASGPLGHKASYPGELPGVELYAKEEITVRTFTSGINLTSVLVNNEPLNFPEISFEETVRETGKEDRKRELRERTTTEAATAAAPSRASSLPPAVHDRKRTWRQRNPCVQQQSKSAGNYKKSAFSSSGASECTSGYSEEQGGTSRDVGTQQGRRRHEQAGGRSDGKPEGPGTPQRGRRQKNRHQPKIALDGHSAPEDQLFDGAPESELYLGSSERRTVKSMTANSENIQKHTAMLKDNKKSFRKPKSKMADSPEVKGTRDVDSRTLLSRLKIRTLNYLKTVDVKLVIEEKQVVRELLYGDDKAHEKIRNRVRISDIQTTDVFRAYAKELGILSKLSTEVIYRRIRREILEMKTVRLVQPTTTEKRKIRYLIKRCLLLKEKAEELIAERRIPKKQFESLKKEVADVLNTIHKTMEVVYSLRDMCRVTIEEELEDKSLLSDLVLGRRLPEPVRSSALREYASLYLLLDSRRPEEGLLCDRKLAWLARSVENVSIAQSDLLNNHHLLSRFHDNNEFNIVQIRFFSALRSGGLLAKDVWNEANWTMSLVIGHSSFPLNLRVEDVSDKVCDPDFVRQREIQSYFENCCGGKSRPTGCKPEEPMKEEQAERCSKCEIC